MQVNEYTIEWAFGEWEPTPELRLVDELVSTGLQQKWVRHYYAQDSEGYILNKKEEDWRDVPVVDHNEV